MTRYRNEVNDDLAEWQRAKSQINQEETAIIQLEKEIETLTAVQTLVQEVAAKAEEKIHSQIATIVSRCLSSVFGKEAYNFEISFLKKRGKTEALIAFARNGESVDPLSASGGGVVDVASFALRIVSILCSIPRLRRLVILDEPVRHLAPELRPIAMQLIKELAEELEMQFIVVSHFTDVDLAEYGKVIQIGEK